MEKCKFCDCELTLLRNNCAGRPKMFCNRSCKNEYYKSGKQPISIELSDEEITNIQNLYDGGLNLRKISDMLHIKYHNIFALSLNKKICVRTKSENCRIRLTGKKLSEETKKKISIARKKFLAENPHMVPYKLNHKHKETYPEKYFTECFGNRFGKEGKVLLYSLDFYDNDLKWDIEIDGEQHYVDPKIVEHDKIRNKKLTDLGWTIIRIRWSYFVKLSHEERKTIIASLMNGIVIEQPSITVITTTSCSMPFVGVPIYKSHSTKKRSYKKPLLKERVRLKDRNKCNGCGVGICSAAKTCESCYHKSRRLFLRPSKEDLQDHLSKLSICAIARLYGCSDNTIRKWKKYYKITD